MSAEKVMMLYYCQKTNSIMR